MPIKMIGSTSGVSTLTAPAVAGNAVLTLPTLTGTLIGTGDTGTVTQPMIQGGPAFGAYGTVAQTITAGVNAYGKISFQAKEFDTNSAFDNTTNYRFQPTASGFYQINAAVQTSSSVTLLLASIYKNGSAYKYGNYTITGGSTVLAIVTSIVFLNGTTDYLEIWASTNLASWVTNPGIGSTYFNGCMLRSG